MLSTTRNPHEKRDDSPHLLAVASLALLQDTPGKLTECNQTAIFAGKFGGRKLSDKLLGKNWPQLGQSPQKEKSNRLVFQSIQFLGAILLLACRGLLSNHIYGILQATEVSKEKGSPIFPSWCPMVKLPGFLKKLGKLPNWRIAHLGPLPT